MQPDQQQQPNQQWQQPNSQPSGAPYINADNASARYQAPQAPAQPAQVQSQPQPLSSVDQLNTPVQLAQQPQESAALEGSQQASEPSVAPVYEEQPLQTESNQTASDATEQVEVQQSPQSEPIQNIQGATLTEPVSWVANEYTTEAKSPMWYGLFFVVFALLMIFAILNKIISLIILLPIMAVALIFYTRRPPQKVQYSLTTKGLYINDKLYLYSDYKHFGMTQKLSHYTVTMVPVKRFAPALTFDFDESVGEKIIDMLGARMPMQEMKPDVIDKFLSRIKL